MNTYFPKTVKGFHFLQELNDLPARSEYSFAEYEKGNVKAIAKLFRGNPNARGAQFLKNEYAMYKLAHSFFVDKDISIAGRRVIIPPSYAFLQDGDMTLLITKKVSGALLPTHTVDFNVTVLEALVTMFKRTQNHKGLQKLHNRSWWKLLAFFVVYSVISCCKKPQFIGTILSIIPQTFMGLFIMGREDSESLVHRDLGGYNNIFVSDTDISVLDFQISAVSHWIFDVANIITTRWYQTEFSQSFIAGSLVSSILNDPSQRKILRALIFHAAVTEIATNNSDSDHETRSLIAWGRSI